MKNTTYKKQFHLIIIKQLKDSINIDNLDIEYLLNGLNNMGSYSIKGTVIKNGKSITFNRKEFLTQKQLIFFLNNECNEEE